MAVMRSISLIWSLASFPFKDKASVDFIRFFCLKTSSKMFLCSCCGYFFIRGMKSSIFEPISINNSKCFAEYFAEPFAISSTRPMVCFDILITFAEYETPLKMKIITTMLIITR